MKSLLKCLVAAVVLTFWVSYVYSDWQSFSALSWKLDPVCLMAAFFFYLAFYLMTGVGWVLALRSMDHGLDFLAALHVWIVATPARYIPGRVWHIAGRAYMGSRLGIPTRDLLVASFLENTLALVAGLIVVLVSTAMGEAALGISSAYFLVLIPLGLALAHPRVLAAGARMLGLLPRLRMFAPAAPARQSPLCGPPETKDMVSLQPYLISMRYSQVLALVAWFAFSHVLAGVSLYLVLAALSPVSLDLLPRIVGLNASAWVIGLVSLVTPGGIGVREATVVVLGSSFLAAPVLTAAAFIFRFLSALAEILLVAGSAALARLLRRGAELRSI